MLIKTKLSGHFNFWLLGLGVAGALFVLLSTSRFGLATSPDSASYVSAAKSFLSGNGYLKYNGTSFVEWPPLYPTLLAFFGMGGLNLLQVARFVNAVAMGLSVIVAGFWISRNISSLPLALLGSIAILFSIPLIQVSVYVWSEPLFILLVLLFLLTIGDFFRTSNLTMFLLSTIFAALACLTRYVGITLILTGLVLLLLRRDTTVVHKYIKAITFVLISALPTIVWLLRNYLISSTLIGERDPSSAHLAGNVYSMLDTVTMWFLPNLLPAILRIAIVGLPLAAMIAVLSIHAQHNQNQEERTNSLRVVPMTCFVLIYVSYLIVSATITAFDPLNSRLLSPLYVPLIFMILFSAESLPKILNKYISNEVLGRVLLVGFAVWLAYPVLYTVAKASDFLQNGAGGYNSPLWRNSSLMLYLKQHQLPGQVYSNSPYAVYLYTGLPARLSPRKYLYYSHVPVSVDLVRFRATLTSGDDIYLDWFDNENSSYLYNPTELGSMFDMLVMDQTPDGVIYRIRSRGH